MDEDKSEYFDLYGFLQPESDYEATAETIVDYDEVDDQKILDTVDELTDNLAFYRDVYEGDKDKLNLYIYALANTWECVYLQVPLRPAFDVQTSLRGEQYGYIVCGKCLMPIYDRLFEKNDFNERGQLQPGMFPEGLHGTEWCPHCGKKIDWSGVNFREYFDG